jgi:hypothetical protein
MTEPSGGLLRTRLEIFKWKCLDRWSTLRFWRRLLHMLLLSFTCTLFVRRDRSHLDKNHTDSNLKRAIRHCQTLPQQHAWTWERQVIRPTARASSSGSKRNVCNRNKTGSDLCSAEGYFKRNIVLIICMCSSTAHPSILQLYFHMSLFYSQPQITHASLLLKARLKVSSRNRMKLNLQVTYIRSKVTPSSSCFNELT